MHHAHPCLPHPSCMPHVMCAQCGWCEAINDLKQQPLHYVSEPHQHNHHQQHALDYYTQQQHQWEGPLGLQPAIWQPSWVQQRNTAGAAAPQQPDPAVWQPQQQHSIRVRGSSHQGGSSRRGWRRWWRVLLAAWRWMVVALVLVLVGSIAGCGIITLLPLVCTTWPTYIPNVSLALLLLFQILFNYAAAVLRPAGRVSDFFGPPLRTADGTVPRAGLQYWSWCQACQAAKPPHTHHCKTCGTCVVQMDHRESPPGSVLSGHSVLLVQGDVLCGVMCNST